jgi:UDP-glucose 6-dehydrogenase
VTGNVEGNVAGLVEPVGVLSQTGKFVFGVTSDKQNIKDIALTNGPLVEPELVAFSGTAVEETTEELTFTGGANVEVM